MAAINQTFTLLTNKNYAQGEKRLSNPQAIPVGVDYARIDVLRSNLPDDPTRVVTVSADISFDGGVTWSSDPVARQTQNFGAFPIMLKTSGTQVDANGDVIGPISSIATRVPQPLNPNRVVRGELTAVKACRTTVTVTITGQT